ncbi:kinase-like domain-containing protein [Crepidotus variabilis]|uniref:Kinase-like domain-containing protein n=1 Tax=Crepidotus variabilis TaxID=179855 RepID=A0A9P6JQZ1_9AGAR|nr:kinase-like domain-containing protein [Crepidotus variabilis]
MSIDAILQLLAIPAPGLGPALQLACEIWVLIEDIRIGKEQLEVLATCSTQLLSSLHPQYRSGKFKESNTRGALQELHILLSEILDFIHKQRQISFFKLIIVKDERKASIDSFYKRITASVNAFQIVSLVNILQWQANHDQAREDDRQALNETLRRLEANTVKLDEVLLGEQKSPRAVMATLQKMIEKENDNPREVEFFKKSLTYLRTTSGQVVDMQPWTVTSVEVEFGELIGIGGFGKVFRGKWNRMDVALKVMKNKEDLSPHATTIKREVEAWSSVKHPHILQFLGANILDNDPFIVMPFIKNGNARSYLIENFLSDRTKLAHQISLALCYLHNVPIIHGDLKLVNVLIDDGGNALLSDFGLARMKQDMMSRSTKADSNSLFGSQNWMAPELFEGKDLRRSCDVYSFAMTLYEIFTLEIPLGHVSPNRVPDLVSKDNRRPERPDPEAAPQLTDSMWDIIEQCWVSDPENRPKAAAIPDKLAALMKSSTPDLIFSDTSISQSRIRSGSTSSNPRSPPISQLTLPTALPVSPLSISSSNSGRNRESLISIPELTLPPSFGLGPGGELASVFMRARPAKFQRWIVKRSPYEPQAGG